MKKIIKKLHKKLDNSGSSLVLVIVALAFVGILVGALLTAAGYVYRLKLYDYNARDNFYYVEQAMDEIYAGVGSHTVDCMKEAYSYTVENMVRYSLEDHAYVTIDDATANINFKQRFMKNIATSTFFFDESRLAEKLRTYISNSTVKLDDTDLKIVKLDKDGNEINDNSIVPYKIILKNVKLTRTAEYARSTANGTFTQSITTDIVVTEPAFTVSFQTIDVEYDHVFTFAMIADSGIEISQQTSVPLTINGNIYAAADYYNKSYNTDADKNYEIGGKNYTTNKVIATNIDSGGTDRTYYNLNALIKNSGVTDDIKTANYSYNGINELSRYSGLYINGSDVSVMADTVIVPGTIGVFNMGTFSLYGNSGNSVDTAEVWADNVVLGGYARTTGASAKSATAYIRANMYVRDDLELNADGSYFELIGGYYGFGDSTTKDDRVFLETVNPANFQIGTGENAENRGHYNSSSIIVNGEKATLDLVDTQTIFLAGRTYIEMSKRVSEGTLNLGTERDPDNVVTRSYTYDSQTDDFRTGESISVRTNQLAYIPITYEGVPTRVAGGDYYMATPNPALVDFYQEIFEKTTFTNSSGVYQLPCIGVTVSGRVYYYIDFQRAYDMLRANDKVAPEDTADTLAEDFIVAYSEELNDPDSLYSQYLTDIGNYEDFVSGTVKLTLPSAASPHKIYSSGAVTVKTGTTVNIVSQKDDDITSELAGSAGMTTANVLTLTDDYEDHYKFVKWALQDLQANSDEAIGVKDMDEDDITPINRYFNFAAISEGDAATIIRPIRVGEDANAHAENRLILNSGSVWVSGEELVTIEDNDGDGIVRGIVITKGNVAFADDVNRFEGLIVAGGKIFIDDTDNVRMITANVELCKAILRECLTSNDPNAKKVLEIFNRNVQASEGSDDSGDASDDSAGSTGDVTDPSTVPLSIDNIDYSDVIRYDNWMKNVE